MKTAYSHGSNHEDSRGDWRFSQRYRWRFSSSEMLRHVDWWILYPAFGRIIVRSSLYPRYNYLLVSTASHPRGLENTRLLPRRHQAPLKRRYWLLDSRRLIWKTLNIQTFLFTFMMILRKCIPIFKMEVCIIHCRPETRFNISNCKCELMTTAVLSGSKAKGFELYIGISSSY